MNTVASEVTSNEMMLGKVTQTEALNACVAALKKCVLELQSYQKHYGTDLDAQDAIASAGSAIKTAQKANAS